MKRGWNRATELSSSISFATRRGVWTIDQPRLDHQPLHHHLEKSKTKNLIFCVECVQ
jgi:hypothetical protein